MVSTNHVEETYDDSSLIEKLDNLQRLYENLKKQMVSRYNVHAVILGKAIAGIWVIEVVNKGVGGGGEMKQISNICPLYTHLSVQNLDFQ